MNAEIEIYHVSTEIIKNVVLIRVSDKTMDRLVQNCENYAEGGLVEVYEYMEEHVYDKKKNNANACFRMLHRNLFNEDCAKSLFTGIVLIEKAKKNNTISHPMP